jgi:hypothetical protein
MRGRAPAVPLERPIGRQDCDWPPVPALVYKPVKLEMVARTAG